MKMERLIDDISFSIDQSIRDAGAPGLIGRQTANTAIQDVLDIKTKDLAPEQRERVMEEFTASGPLAPYINDLSVTEIMVCAKNEIWIEKHGSCFQSADHFLSDLTYNNFIQRLFAESALQTNYATPYANGHWMGFRIHIISPPLVGNHVLTLRRVRSQAISLEQLRESDWCNAAEADYLKQLVHNKKTILVVGNTGSGKTTLLNALLLETNNERSLLIEDTSELLAPNTLSLKLLTRFDCQGVLPDITQTELVKQSLRMRPDRLIIGEIRGAEAKDLLLALSTGHKGSMTSMHAYTPEEALIRLEMLIQMGAPQWSLDAIRKLIHLCVDNLVVTRKDGEKWYMEGVYKIASLEKFGFIVEKLML